MRVKCQMCAAGATVKEVGFLAPTELLSVFCALLINCKRGQVMVRFCFCFFKYCFNMMMKNQNIVPEKFRINILAAFVVALFDLSLKYNAHTEQCIILSIEGDELLQ